MLKDLSEKERRTHRQIELALMHSRSNRIQNQRNMLDWQRNKKDAHAVAVDREAAKEATGKVRAKA